MNLLKKFAFGSVAVVGTLSSCINSNSDPITPLFITDCYTVATDKLTGEVTVSTDLSQIIEINWGKDVAQLSFSGFVINNVQYPSMDIFEMKLKYNDWYCNADNPIAQFHTGQLADLTNFNYQLNERANNPELKPGDTFNPYVALVYSFDLDSRYHIEGSRVPFYFWGTSTSVKEGTEPFTSGIKFVTVTPNFENKTVTVELPGAQFNQHMLAVLHIQLDDIPMEFIEGGKIITFEKDFLIPSLQGVKADDYPVYNVKGVLNPAVGLNLEFECNPNKMGLYKVTTSPTVFGYKTPN